VSPTGAVAAARTEELNRRYVLNWNEGRTLDHGGAMASRRSGREQAGYKAKPMTNSRCLTSLSPLLICRREPLCYN
jgi:hypothetical protein